MKKILNQKGFTLMETLVAIAVLAILVMGMGATMNTAVRVYGESIFESNSGTLAGILNTSLGDILRYGDGVTINPGKFIHRDGTTEIPKEKADFIFTNYEYGAIDSYLVMETTTGSSPRTTVQLKNLLDSNTRELVSNGSYPNLTVYDFTATFTPHSSTERGNYFTIRYKIKDIHNDHRIREVEHTVRLMNPIDE